MNAAEARGCLQVLVAGFPKWEPEDDSVVLLAEVLGRWEYDVGFAACRELVELDDRSWPSVNRLLLACQRSARAAARQETQRALPEGRAENWQQLGAQRAREVREQLHRGGDHGG